MSVVIPMRNEVAHIERTVASLLGQGYGGDLDVVCVDGMSDDGTRALLGQLVAADPRVRMIDNPKQITPAAMNAGIKAARYPLILRMDAHAVPGPNYIRRSVEVMQETGADCVGGRWTITGVGRVASAIAAAMTSRFGVGTAQWRTDSRAGETDTVPFGLWRRERLLELGGFDEALIRNQDYELNYRLRASGGRIWYSPEIHADYHSRKTFRALWSQYFQYGFWKARVMRMHPGSTKARHLAAPLFTLGLVVGLLMTLVWGSPWLWAYVAGLSAYTGLAVASAAKVARGTRWSYFPLILWTFVLLHLSWGSGFWLGAIRWWALPRPSPGG